MGRYCSYLLPKQAGELLKSSSLKSCDRVDETGCLPSSRQMDSCFENAFCELAVERNDGDRNDLDDDASKTGTAVEVTIE